MTSVYPLPDKLHEQLAELIATGAANGVSWLDIPCTAGRIIIVFDDPAANDDASLDTTAPAPAPVRPVDRRDRLPWTDYAEDIRETLKDLTRRYPAAIVADAAAELELLVALHGPLPAKAADR